MPLTDDIAKTFNENSSKAGHQFESYLAVKIGLFKPDYP